MITGLDHVAIAVPDLDASIRTFCEGLGLENFGIEHVQQAKTSVATLAANTQPAATKIELVHPLDGAGPIAKFLAKGRRGLHHLCFRTDNIESDIAKLKQRGYQFLADGPTAGKDGTQVIFLDPACFDGVLVELCQYP